MYIMCILGVASFNADIPHSFSRIDMYTSIIRYWHQLRMRFSFPGLRICNIKIVLFFFYFYHCINSFSVTSNSSIQQCQTTEIEWFLRAIFVIMSVENVAAKFFVKENKCEGPRSKKLNPFWELCFVQRPWTIANENPLGTMKCK